MNKNNNTRNLIVIAFLYVSNFLAFLVGMIEYDYRTLSFHVEDRIRFEVILHITAQGWIITVVLMAMLTIFTLALTYVASRLSKHLFRNLGMLPVLLLNLTSSFLVVLLFEVVVLRYSPVSDHGLDVLLFCLTVVSISSLVGAAFARTLFGSPNAQFEQA